MKMMNIGIFLIIHNIYGYVFALLLGYGPHKNANLFNDSSLPAYDLAHITVCNTYFIYYVFSSLALGHRDFVGIIHEALYYIGQ